MTVIVSLPCLSLAPGIHRCVVSKYGSSISLSWLMEGASMGEFGVDWIVLQVCGAKGREGEVANVDL